MIKGIQAIRAYGGSRVQEESLVARNVQDPEVQIRIAEKSDHRLVLMNLAMNHALSDEAVQALYARDKKYLTNRLNALGYEKAGFLGF